MKDQTIINLTQHEASNGQLADGVFEPMTKYKEKIKELLTFNEPPTKEEIKERAELLADEAAFCSQAMIDGPLWLMGPLAKALKERAVVPLFAFSERVVIEKMDGKKVSVFKHVGFVEAV